MVGRRAIHWDDPRPSSFPAWGLLCAPCSPTLDATEALLLSSCARRSLTGGCKPPTRDAQLVFQVGTSTTLLPRTPLAMFWPRGCPATCSGTAGSPALERASRTTLRSPLRFFSILEGVSPRYDDATPSPIRTAIWPELQCHSSRVTS